MPTPPLNHRHPLVSFDLAPFPSLWSCSCRPAMVLLPTALCTAPSPAFVAAPPGGGAHLGRRQRSALCSRRPPPRTRSYPLTTAALDGSLRGVCCRSVFLFLAGWAAVAASIADGNSHSPGVSVLYGGAPSGWRLPCTRWQKTDWLSLLLLCCFPELAVSLASHPVCGFPSPLFEHTSSLQLPFATR